MVKTIYRVIQLQDRTFAVEVTPEGGKTTLVSGFKDEPAAAAWAALEQHRQKEAGSSLAKDR